MEVQNAEPEMGRRLAALAAGIAVIVALIVWYVAGYLTVSPPTVAVSAKGVRTVNLTLQTVASLGPKYEQPSWVSYLVKNEKGQWVHSTVWTVPAHALVHVTVYQFDGASGLRNPFLGRPQGVLGDVMQVDGKTLDVLNPEDASHTFSIPDYHLVVPLAAVPDNAKNQCEAAPCTLAEAHRTITFTFRTGAPGRIRWQCFVPCAAGFIYGFAGPMQTIGYMDGFLHVV
jgi:hypothetical protein